MRAVKQPEAEIPSGYLSQRALPFPRAESRRTMRERERERERGSRFKWISTLALLPIKRLASTLESSNGKIVETSAFLRDVRSEITVLELPFK